jgi:beta-galactosidase
LQVENEFGSYGQDAAYLKALRDAWKQEGIDLALYTADGPGETMLKNGSIPGCIVGLDPGANAADFAQARKYRPDVPAFCSEYYPGWLTHWGENWARTDTLELLRDLEWLIQNGKSWNLYMLHGGTNFGFYAGANMAETYQPDLTSYDYDAPIREDGSLTPKYFAIRRLMQKYSKNPLPAQPRAVMRMGLGVMQPQPVAHLMDLLPTPRASNNPLPMEQYGQNFGCILYRITLAQATPKGAVLEVNDVHDYAQVYVNRLWIGTLDRTKKVHQLSLPAAVPAGAQLDILVEGMGRINYGRHLADLKGITEKVTLNAQILTGWQVYNLPFEDDFVQRIGPAADTSAWNGQPGRFFRAEFQMASLGDTYLDMSAWQKGYVWVNGRHLGRYWNRGPQQRLYVPGSFMRKGANAVLILDFHQTVSAPLRGFESLDGN